jgi:hypothetical protein
VYSLCIRAFLCFIVNRGVVGYFLTDVCVVLWNLSVEWQWC